MKILLIEDKVQLIKSILSYLIDKKYGCDLAEDFASTQEKLEFLYFAGYHFTKWKRIESSSIFKR